MSPQPKAEKAKKRIKSQTQNRPRPAVKPEKARANDPGVVPVAPSRPTMRQHVGDNGVPSNAAHLVKGGSKELAAPSGSGTVNDSVPNSVPDAVEPSGMQKAFMAGSLVGVIVLLVKAANIF